MYMPLSFDLAGRRCVLIGSGGLALRKAKLLGKSATELRVIVSSNEKLRAQESGDLVEGRELSELIQDSGGSSIACDLDTPGHIPAELLAELKQAALCVVALDKSFVNAESVSSLCQSMNIPVNVVAQPNLCSFVFPAIIDQAPVSIAISTSDTVSASGDTKGEVYLVGAGPGDPELLTIRAMRLMQQADIVYYDRLVSDEVLDLVHHDADRVYVGKQRSNHSAAQESINEMLLKSAKQGMRVLRLKGGDPFIFGRGGEEIEHLAEGGVNFQVVPGVTAASACACYAGIPLTHRDHAQSVRFITGHLKDGSLDLPWHEFLQEQQTLVFYMGLVSLPLICQRMIEHGRDPSTPVALVYKGTLPGQRIVIGRLDSIADLAAEQQLKSPTITIIGDVVRLQKTLSWFESDHQTIGADIL